MEEKLLCQIAFGSAPGKHFLQNRVGATRPSGHGLIERRPNPHVPMAVVTKGEASCPAPQPTPRSIEFAHYGEPSLPRLGARKRSDRYDHRPLSIDPQPETRSPSDHSDHRDGCGKSRSPYPASPSTVDHSRNVSETAVRNREINRGNPRVRRPSDHRERLSKKPEGSFRRNAKPAHVCLSKSVTPSPSR